MNGYSAFDPPGRSQVKRQLTVRGGPCAKGGQYGIECVCAREEYCPAGLIDEKMTMLFEVIENTCPYRSRLF
jgi:hypothetical protein